MAFLDFLNGTPERMQQVQRFAPNQQNLQNQSIQQALGLLQGMQNPQQQFQNAQQGFQPFAQQARQQFQQSTIPGLAERFTSLGGQRSSAFQGALGQAGSQLESNLASLGSQYGLQQQGMQQNQLNSLLGYGLQPSFETLLRPAQPGFLQSLAPGIGSGIGNIGSLYALLRLLGGGIG